MKKYEKYKKSNFPFHREIPAHWGEIALNRAYSLKSITNNNDEQLLSVFLNKGVINYSATNQKQVHKPSEDLSKYQLVEPGDFVLNNQQAWRGSVGVSKYRGIISPAYYVWNPRSDYNNDYMNYMVRDKDVINQFVIASKGVGSIQRQIYVPFLKTTIMAIPPREEQDQIVRYLDWKVSSINHLIHSYKEQINLLEEHKRTLVDNAVTKGLDCTAEMKNSGVNWLGEIPNKWRIISIAQIFTEVKCKNSGLTENNLLSLSYGKVVKRNIDATEGLLPDSFEGYNIIEKDDIVLRLTDLQNDQKSLRTGISKERGIITSAYITIRNRSTNLSSFLQFHLHAFDLGKGFYNVGASGVRQSLNWDTIKSLPIAVPPLAEQLMIVNYIDKQTEKIDLLKEKITKQIEFLKEYRTRLISDVVTGQVDVRGEVIPDYTPEEDTVTAADGDDSEDEMDDESEAEKSAD